MAFCERQTIEAVKRSVDAKDLGIRKLLQHRCFGGEGFHDFNGSEKTLHSLKPIQFYKTKEIIM